MTNVAVSAHEGEWSCMSAELRAFLEYLLKIFSLKQKIVENNLEILTITFSIHN